MELTGETVDFGKTEQLWPAIESSMRDMQRADGLWQQTPLITARKVDQSNDQGHRAYISAHRLLVVAHETHEAFSHLVGKVGFTPNAPFTLLRAVLESSLWALWILDPKESAERVRRGLWFEVWDFREETAYLGELGKLQDGGKHWRDLQARRQANAGQKYRGAAKSIGVDYSSLTRKPNLVDSIPGLQWLSSKYDKDTMTRTAAEWRRLSGYNHTKTWPSMFGSDRTDISRVQGGHTARFVASDAGIQMAFGTAGLALLEGLRLFTHRCTRPA